MKKKRLLTDRSGQLQEQILEQKAQELANEIDAQILRGMLLDLGWYEIVLQPMTLEAGVEIDAWVQQQVKGRSHWTHGLVWMFESEQDANWFKLRWLS